MILIGCTEAVVQFSDQVTHFGRCLDRSFDRDAHRASADVSVFHGLAFSALDGVCSVIRLLTNGDDADG